MNIIIFSVPQLPLEIPVENPNFVNIKTPVCYWDCTEDVTTQAASIKTLFINEILELKNEIAETKHQISESGYIQTSNCNIEKSKF